MKAMRSARAAMEAGQGLVGVDGGVSLSNGRRRVPVCECIWRITISKGRELMRV